jgi:predicted membrane protein
MKKNVFTIVLKWGFILGVVLSLIQFLRTFNHLEYFAIDPILNLMQFVSFIAILLLGMKEYRDDSLHNAVKFSKTFLLGASMVFIAFVLVVAYLIIHYNYIDKEAIHKLNERNRLRYVEKMEIDTVTQEELTQYIHYVENCFQTTILDEPIQACNVMVEENLSILKYYYTLRMQNRLLADSNAYQLKNFDQYAQRQLLDLTEQIMTQQKEDTFCSQAFVQIVQVTIQQLQKKTLFDKRYEENIDQLPQYTNIFATALYFSVSILIFGLFFSIFVALYVYREKRTKEKEEQHNDE